MTNHGSHFVKNIVFILSFALCVIFTNDNNFITKLETINGGPSFIYINITIAVFWLKFFYIIVPNCKWLFIKISLFVIAFCVRIVFLCWIHVLTNIYSR